MKTLGLTNKDIFNARNGAKFEGNSGIEGILKGVAISEPDEKKVVIIKIDDVCYSGTSTTVYEDAKILIEQFEQEIKAGTLRVFINSRTSKGGRSFYNIELKD